MPQIGGRSIRKSDFVKYELALEHRFCEEFETVNTTTAGADKMVNGAVVFQDAGAGDYIELTDAFDATTDNIAIVIDDTIVEVTDGADADLALLVRGPAIVALEGLVFGAATDNGAAAIAALEANDILVRNRM